MNQENNRHQYQPGYTNYRDDEINLIDYLRVLWKWKVFIALVVALCVLVVGSIMFIKYPTRYVTTCTVSLSFPGIEKHENPDGTVFTKEQLITPVLLNRLYDLLHQDIENIKAGELRGMLQVTSFIPAEVRARIDEAKKNNEIYPFFPNHFVISLTSVGNRIFSDSDRTAILNGVIDEYRKDFEKKYREEPLVTINFPKNFLEQYDYQSILTVFETKIDNLLQYLNSKIQKAGYYRDTETGLSFTDIRDDLRILKDVELKTVIANVDTLHMVRDREDTVNQYMYKIKEIEILEKKKKEEAKAVRDLLKVAESIRYYAVSGDSSVKRSEGSTNLVIDSSFIENLVKNDYYSYLLKQALNAEVAARNLNVDKEYLQNRIGILQNQAKNNSGKLNEKVSTEMKSTLQRIQEKIQSAANKANELNKSYLSSIITGVARIIGEPETQAKRSVDLTKRLLLVGIVALFGAVFLAFFIEYIQNAISHKKTEG